MNLCQQAYRLRDAEPAMRELARRVGLLHVQEFGNLRAPLVRDLGVVPRVPTFQNLPTLLAEDGDHQQAIEVCEKAIRFGLSDGTKGDFPARIERLRKEAPHGKMVTQRGPDVQQADAADGVSVVARAAGKRRR